MSQCSDWSSHLGFTNYVKNAVRQNEEAFQQLDSGALTSILASILKWKILDSVDDVFVGICCFVHFVHAKTLQARVVIHELWNIYLLLCMLFIDWWIEWVAYVFVCTMCLWMHIMIEPDASWKFFVDHDRDDSGQTGIDHPHVLTLLQWTWKDLRQLFPLVPDAPFERSLKMLKLYTYYTINIIYIYILVCILACFVSEFIQVVLQKWSDCIQGPHVPPVAHALHISLGDSDVGELGKPSKNLLHQIAQDLNGHNLQCLFCSGCPDKQYVVWFHFLFKRLLIHESRMVSMWYINWFTATDGIDC